MTRARRCVLGLVGVGAGAAVLVVAVVPPGPTVVGESGWQETPGVTVVAGAFHVHTDRSDGAGTVDEVAAAAARAGLQFVVFADHGNGMRPLEPPTYRHGVLCVDGVEISTAGGHYTALDLRPAPYPLAGEPRDVVEDVARLGGFGFVAHPTSAKPALAWTDWSAPFDGLEWLNADAEWRDEAWPALARVLLAYWVRPPAALASLLDRPALALARWDALAVRRRVVAVAASDAHGRIDVGGEASGPDRWSPIRVPSYEASFRSFATRVELDAPFGGRADEDARRLLAAVRAGRVFSAIDALARPVRFAFTAAVRGRVVARTGESVRPDGPVTLAARVRAPAGSEIVLLQDGRAVARGRGDELVHETTVERAAFRVEVYLPRGPGTPPVPWIVSNPIYVGPRSGEGETPPPRLPAQRVTVLGRPGDASGWAVEADAASRAAVGPQPGPRGRELAFRYAIAGGSPRGQYAALVWRIEAPAGLAGHDRLLFRVRSSRPARVEVQLRQPDGGDGLRWQRSVYVDETPRAVTVFFDDLTPVGKTPVWRPDLARVGAILFVIDTNHTPPGTAGVLWLDEVRLGAP
jgi:hypothetical protein